MADKAHTVIFELEEVGMVGRVISHYRVLEKLGAGGMGVVYKAQDLDLNRFAALKFLHDYEAEDGRERFIQEALAASALDHPNICTIYERGKSDDGRVFLAMAYYAGPTLHKKIAQGPMPLNLALDISLQTALGLAKAHEKQIVHRDIKPANLVLTEDGTVKILDFGVAKVPKLRLTPGPVKVGTPAYMSPEQVAGMKVDSRTDIWSLGVVLYEMLTGQLPFQEEYDWALEYSIQHETPRPIEDSRPDIPPDLDRIVTTALTKNPEERYQRAADMAQDLRSLQKELSLLPPIQNAHPQRGKRATPPRRTPGRTDFSFGEFEVDVSAGELRKGWTRIRIQDQPFRVLVAMLERPGDVVTREELVQKLWPGQTFVDFDQGLNTAVRKLRDVLCDSATKPRYIETLPKRGYRFIAFVERVPKTRPPEPAKPPEERRSPFLNWEMLLGSRRQGASSQPRPPSIEKQLTPGPGNGKAAPRPGTPPTRPTLTRRQLVTASCVLTALLPVSATVIPSIRHGVMSQACLAAPGPFPWCVLPDDRHLSVLPFDTSQCAEWEHKEFCEGFVQSLRTRLAGLEQFHDTLCVHRAKDEGDLWDDSLVLAGSVDREGEITRLTVKVLNSDRSVQLREYSVEAPIADTRLLQGGIVSSIAEMLELDLGAVAVPGGTAIYEAYAAYLEGLAYLKQQELGKAVLVFQEAVRYDPHYASALGGLCEAFRRVHQTSSDPEALTKAERNCVAALEESSDLPAVQVSLGRIRATQKEAAKARKHFDAAAELDPLHQGLPGLYNRLGDFESAELAHLRRAKLKPACFSHQNRLAIFYFYGGQYDKAEEHYRKAIDLAPNYYHAYINLGWLYSRQRRYEEASAALEKSLVLKPTPLGYSNLGLAYYYVGRYEEAVTSMEQARDLGQSGYLFWGNLAEAYRMTVQWADLAPGAFAKAIKLAEQERVRNRDDATLLSYLAGFYARLGQEPAALRDIADARRLNPRDVEVMYRSVAVYEILGRRNEALKAVAETLENGFSCEVMREGPDLGKLRQDDRYQRLEEMHCGQS